MCVCVCVLPNRYRLRVDETKTTHVLRVSEPRTQKKRTKNEMEPENFIVK